jgi:uncharacterized protein (TIGR02594 family)
LLLPSCVADYDANSPDITAQTYIGYHERENRIELTELLEVDPVRTEWCAAFVNAILELDNIPNLHDIDSPAPLMARSFLTWGERVDTEDIEIGDIVIFPRGNEGWQGHVGFFMGATDNYWIILGGNQDNTVSYKLFRPKRVIGIRRWTE